MDSASFRRVWLFSFLAVFAPQSPAPTSPEVCAADLERHVFTLAADSMKGRSTGSPEAMEAARYLAGELKRMGLEPAGDEGTYFQRVPMVRTEFLEIPTLECTDRAGVKSVQTAGVDFDLAAGGCEARSLRVVTAAAAAEIPKQADNNGALVLIAASADERRVWLEAAGIPEGEGWGLLITLGAKSPGRQALDGPPRPRTRIGPATPRISARGNLRQAFVDRKIASLTIRAPIRAVELEAANVVARLDGVGSATDKALASEVIEFSAHYDHLAPRQVREGEDGIFNGADDDASGCAVVLELAEAFAHGPKPARTLLFFFATGEEIGLVGTRHALEHPPVPLDKIVLDVNFEMLGRPDPKVSAPARMWLTGFERSDLGPELQRLGVPVVPDMRPEQNYFQRSDNYALALRGIVAQTLSTYGGHTDYHEPSDEAASLDYAHMEACARGAFAGCRAIADGSFRPRWREGLDPSKPKAREAAPVREKAPPPKDG